MLINFVRRTRVSGRFLAKYACAARSAFKCACTIEVRRIIYNDSTWM